MYHKQRLDSNYCSTLHLSFSLSLILSEYCDKYEIKGDDKIFTEHLFFIYCFIFIIVQQKNLIQIICDNKAMSKCISKWGPEATIYWIIYKYILGVFSVLSLQ